MYKHFNIFNVIGLLFKISISEICKGTCISGTCRNTGFNECTEYIDTKAIKQTDANIEYEQCRGDTQGKE